MFIYISCRLRHALRRLVQSPRETDVKRYLPQSLPFALLLALPCALAVAAPAAAQSGNASARASGEIVGGSVEAAATLGSAGVAVTAASVVAVTGTTAAIITADAELADETMELAGDIAAAPFSGYEKLDVDDAIVVPDAPPAVPQTPHGPRPHQDRSEP